ncbi:MULTISPECIES: zinc dependent phospholipase C family protein [unclassified Pseudodesulfovibrio]|uniref:zinc dependent phospholipase C family protein n=1 Tax=unclassified Pseudodesulfovibrio TaxID=2661612 RepID=UPI000FEC0F41|nr:MULTISPECIES: zinc dependent phospholipase C family protein [unclassified Pseudodesulfovibrio]MCJ2163123.1 zinc dependent phospholipase C family protein [Pseudodesulfovibrio sp. S3-i]RWU07115.1 hypothetical protein DWB63_01000 [Pseudodesulfovibrio sp. S3]
MPKELIHFKVAEMTATNLTGTRFALGLKAYPQGLLLGAIFHDVPYYGITASARPMEKVAHELHGADGQDTYSLLRLQARYAALAPDRNLAAALLVGMVSHLCADTVMHPMVWHLSGDYHAPIPTEQSRARQRHRALESLMDMTACPEMLGQPRYKVKHLLEAIGDPLFKALPMKDLADLANISPEQAVTGLCSAFTVFARLQLFFPFRPLARILYALYPWLPNPAREVVALFYAPQLLDQADRIKGQILYHDPVSGTQSAAALTDLMVTAADKAGELCRLLEPTVFDNTPLALLETGPSLDSGKPDTSSRKMHHWANPPFPRLS